MKNNGICSNENISLLAWYTNTGFWQITRLTQLSQSTTTWLLKIPHSSIQQENQQKTMALITDYGKSVDSLSLLSLEVTTN